jgi:hypothetical protein
MKTKLIYKKNPHEETREFICESSLLELIKKSEHIFAAAKEHGNPCYYLTYDDNHFVISWKNGFGCSLKEEVISFKRLVSGYDIFTLTEEDLFNFLTGE